jgi:hypothetical protein
MNKNEFKWIVDYLPKPQSIDKPDNNYYLVKTKFGNSLSMYVLENSGESKWYSDYQSELKTEVIAWSEIPEMYETMKKLSNQNERNN